MPGGVGVSHGLGQTDPLRTDRAQTRGPASQPVTVLADLLTKSTFLQTVSGTDLRA